ncbi:MAG: endonuclease [Proteobacteria bacterium]|nr:endonuclease [Pseudomonadota bacterium]
MKTKLLLSFLILFPFVSTAGVEDLLITEVVVTPTNAEFIEIYNNGPNPINLSNVYLTDATFSNGNVYYYQVVNGAGGGGGFNDFNARFPDGAMIASGEYQTISITGSTNFFGVYNENPTYELYEDAGVADSVDDMRDAFTDSIATPTNTSSANCAGAQTSCPSSFSGGEVAILYSWDGITDLVQDLDYVVWGDKVEAVDKTGIAIDGPDADVTTSTYLNDTAISSQAEISVSSHVGGMSWQRDVTLNEGTETQAGGNGINGSDETSENLNITFYEGNPTPNTAGTPPPPTAPNIIINEVDAVGTADFVELFGTIGASLNDVTLVLYQGSDDTIYRMVDLSGSTMDASGYFLISDAAGLTSDLALGGNLNDDASAVAIYFQNISDFNVGDSIADVDFVNDIIDAMVYHSGTPDDGGLLALLNVGQVQVNEDGNSAVATESNARCSNGAGGVLNTATYMQVFPTAGSINNTCPVLPYYINADPSTPVTLRTTLFDIIKGHTSFPYSAGTTDTWDILSFADEDHNTAVDLDNMVAEGLWMVYRNNSYPYVGGGVQAYNREHTWPHSYGFSTSASGGSHDPNNAPRTDAHHLMLSDVGYNSTRGNKYFDNCNPSIDNTCTNASLQTAQYDGDGDGVNEGGDTGSAYPGNANWTNSSVFEVWDFRKGDIARAMFYMDVRYENLGEIDSTGTPEPDLVITDDLGLIGPTAGDTAYLGLKSVLLQWHAQDPVDDIERERNEVVFSYQGNRNPFVDHPEWVACVFENNCVFDAMFKDGFE